MIDPEKTAAAIIAKMKSRLLTQVAAAESARMSQSQVSRFCSGRFRRKSRNLKRLCNALEIKIEEKSRDERQLVSLLRSIVRKKPGKIDDLGRALDAIGGLIS